MLAARIDRFGIVDITRPGLFAVTETAGVDHFRKAENRVQRRAQFVAHGGEKFGFQPVGGLRCVPRRRKHAFAILERGNVRKTYGKAAVGHGAGARQIPVSAYAKLYVLAAE